MLKGIDVSRWQGIINCDSVKASGIQFSVIKAAGSDGGQYVDGQFVRNKGEARRVGMPRMFYYFLGGGDPISEANHFVWAVGEGLCLDWERQRVDEETYLAVCARRVKELVGFPPLIYMSASRVHSKPWAGVRALDCGLWIASWGNNDQIPDAQPSPTPWPFFAIWQYCSVGSVSGISGNVDMDLFNSNDINVFYKYGKPPAPPPTQTTTSISTSSSTTTTISTSTTSSTSTSITTTTTTVPPSPPEPLPVVILIKLVIQIIKRVIEWLRQLFSGK